jgi:hypothetical protein
MLEGERLISEQTHGTPHGSDCSSRIKLPLQSIHPHKIRLLEKNHQPEYQNCSGQKFKSNGPIRKELRGRDIQTMGFSRRYELSPVNVSIHLQNTTLLPLQIQLTGMAIQSSF